MNEEGEGLNTQEWEGIETDDDSAEEPDYKDELRCKEYEENETVK